MAERLAIASLGFIRQNWMRKYLSLCGIEIVSPWASADGVIVWGQREVSERGRALAARRNLPVITVEDAFLRSVRPGRVAPLGLILDRKGAHFDIMARTELEARIRKGAHDEERARAGIARLRNERLSKYNCWSDETAPEPGYVLVIDQNPGDAAIAGAGASPQSFAAMLEAARDEHPGKRILVREHPATRPEQAHFPRGSFQGRVERAPRTANPWALLEGAEAVYAVSSQMGFEAIMAGHRPVLFGAPWYAGWGLSDDRVSIVVRGTGRSVEQLFAAAYLGPRTFWIDPFRMERTGFEGACDLLLAETRAFDRTRGLKVGYGFARWKRPLLQSLMPALEFEDDARGAAAKAQRKSSDILVWASREGPEIRLEALKAGREIRRMEDGFLRSNGLGAALTPPLSLTIDRSGIYYDPSSPSDLEKLIAAPKSDEQLARAERLRTRISMLGLSKYNTGGETRIKPRRGQRVILVCGQVKDDASVIAGTEEIRDNLALLHRARSDNPEAFIIYKPHPDVEAGLRSGALPEAGRLADAVAVDTSAPQLISLADEVWTMTSLLGFEALIRGKTVVVFGMPFYAGWGLTEDRGPSCPRRRARPSLAQLVHAVLIEYPLYIDPQTGRAAPVELIVERLATGRSSRPFWLTIASKVASLRAG